MVVFFLLSSFLSSVAAYERIEGVNDCLVNITQEVNVTVTYLEPYEEREFRFCWSIPPRCSYMVRKYRTGNRVETRQVVKESLSCCPGYIPNNDILYYLNVESYPECKPDCQDRCLPSGICIGPNQCFCESGQTRDDCFEDGLSSSTRSELLSKIPMIPTYNDLATEYESTSPSHSTITITTEEPQFTEQLNVTSGETSLLHQNQTTEDDNELWSPSSFLYNSSFENIKTDADDDVITIETVTNGTSGDVIDTNITKPNVEKKAKMIQDISIATVVSVGVVIGLSLILLGSLLLMLRKKIVCGKFVFPRRSLNSLNSENQKTEMDLQDSKSGSTLTLGPCHIEDDPIAPQFQLPNINLGKKQKF